jgi:hypothetical protein
MIIYTNFATIPKCLMKNRLSVAFGDKNQISSPKV